MPRTTRLWEYFEKFGNEEKAICNYCNKILSYKGTSNNLKKHLKLVHFKAYLKLLNSPPLKTAAQRRKETQDIIAGKFEASGEDEESDDEQRQKVKDSGFEMDTWIIKSEDQDEAMSPQNEDNSDPEQIIEYVIEEPEVTQEQLAEERQRKIRDRSERWRKVRHQLEKQRKVRQQLEKHRKVRQVEKQKDQVRCETVDSIAMKVFEKSDEFEHFGGYVAAGLRKLTVKSCIKAQDEIQAVLSKYRLIDLESVSRN